MVVRTIVPIMVSVWMVFVHVGATGEVTLAMFLNVCHPVVNMASVIPMDMAANVTVVTQVSDFNCSYFS